MGSGPLLALGAEAGRGGCSASCGEPGCGSVLGSLLSDTLSGTPEFGAAAEGLSTQCTKVATLSPQSLTGHTSPVESVRLNTPEELIVAGSQSGSIRVWDLEAAKSRHLCSPPLYAACGPAVSGSPVQLLPPGSLTSLGASLLERCPDGVVIPPSPLAGQQQRALLSECWH